MSKTNFTIRRDEWRCGGEPGEPNVRGEGTIGLCNSEGFKCCLGQIADNLGWMMGGSIIILGVPSDVPIEYPEAEIEPNILIDRDNQNTKFSKEAMEINDDPDLTDIQRERALERLGEKYGVRIAFTGEYHIPFTGEEESTLPF